MSAEPHRLGKLDLRASIGDMDLALSLRPRIEALAYRLAPAVIERVCDAALPPDMHLRIDRLDLDLGSLRPDHLEQDMLGALEHALAEAIGKALHDARYAPSDRARLISDAVSALERLEDYLVTGTTHWAGGEGGFAPAAALRGLIDTQPRDLAAMLVRRGRARHLVERLVLQADPESLRDLLAALAPADAAVILALIADVLLAHRLGPSAPLDRLTEAALERLLWITTFEFLLRDAGTQFNRRRFLARLLAREAARLRIDYAVLLDLLAEAIEAARARTGFRSSLPVVLGELLAENVPGGHNTRQETTPRADAIVDALDAAREGDFDALVAETRRLADDRPRLEALIARLDRHLFAGVVRSLEPAGAEAILATIDELGTLEREAAPPPLSGNLEPTLRWLTLHYLLHDAGSQFNRRRFAAHLIAHEAARAGIEYLVLLRVIHTAAERAGSRPGARSSLPGILVELLAEAEQSTDAPGEDAQGGGDPAGVVDALAERLDDAAFARLVRHIMPADSAAILAETTGLAALHRAEPVAAWSDHAFARVLRRVVLAALRTRRGARFDRRAFLRQVIRDIAAEAAVPEHRLRHALAMASAQLGATASTALAAILARETAALKKGSSSGDTVDVPALAEMLRGMSREDAARRLRRAARDPAGLLALAGILPARERRTLLATLAPRNAERVEAQLAAIERLHAAAPLATVDRRRFARLLWALAARHLALAGGARFDPAALARALIEGIAHHDRAASGATAAQVKAALSATTAATVSPVESRARGEIDEVMGEVTQPDPARHPRIAHYLRTGQPHEAGAALAVLATDDPVWLAATLRAMARATPAAVPLLLDRVLAWLLPEELLACLMPGDPQAARRLAMRLERAGDTAWRMAFGALLRGRRPVVPRSGEGLAERFDRLASLAHWLDHGRAPWWSDEAAPGSLVALSNGDVEHLFAGLPPGAALARLRQAARLLGPAGTENLLGCVAPWTTSGGGPFHAMLAALDAGQRRDALLAAAAASLESTAIDLAALAEPSPERPFRPHVAAPAASDAPSFEGLFAWLDGAAASVGEGAALSRYFAQLADSGDARLAAYVADAKKRPAARARWASLLPDESLARLLRLIVPARTRVLLDARAVLDTAWRSVAPFGVSRPRREEWWRVLLDLAARSDMNPGSAIDAMIAWLTARRVDRAPTLRSEALRLAGERGHHAVAAAVRRGTAMVKTSNAVAPPEPPRANAEREPAKPKQEEPAPETAIYIGNAGLVLLGSYLPPLFERLGVLAPDDKGVLSVTGLEATSRAVHLLQYLVDGRLDAPEPTLVLNKLLCGMPTAQPILREIDPDPADLAICDGLLDAVIANWTIIAGTSREGLRETFLQREGRLRHDEEGWNLAVQRKGLDVLIDQIPWSISMIYHRWMPQPVKVTW